MKSLLILSGLCLIATAVLIILHFTIAINSFWFSIPLAIGIILNLISGVIRLKKQRKLKK